MSPTGVESSRFRRLVIGLDVCLAVILALVVGNRAAYGEVSARGNSALFFCGILGLSLSTVALVAPADQPRSGLRLLMLTPALFGVASLALVDFTLLRASGLILTAPALVPVALAVAKVITRKRRLGEPPN